ncbi:MAG: VWA domain-containing protein [Flavobacteriia bacterium]|nr:MAG: VWA domain-containing protein [Flavobacteriia bacterium]
MGTIQFFLILLAFLSSALVVYFQYIYKNGKTSRLTYILLFLRFLSIFAVLILILNLKINRNVTEVVKPKLILLADNSSSIKYIKQDSLSRALLQNLSSDKDLNKRFDIRIFSFGKDLNTGKILSFDESETNIYKALSEIKELFKEKNAPLILITDGNQTFGNDYSYFKSDQAIFPVVLGDTTHFNDLYISNLNVNPYTYIKHRFPVELFINYKGNKKIKTDLFVSNGNKIIYKKKITMSPSKNSLKVDFLLPALDKGKHFYKIELKPIDSEKNRINNVKNFSIEVLDESSKILLLYDILHPDIAFWKRTVESNKQRKIDIKKIDNYKGNLSDYQFVILFQPNQKFKDILSKKINMLIQTGTQTDWSSLNRNQTYFKKEFLDKTELVSPVYNEKFSTFLVKDVNFSKLPPLQNIFGKIVFNVPHQDLLYQGINNIKTGMPLLATIEKGKRRIILIDGENLFAWRNYNYLENRSFEKFDAFTNSIFQFLQDQGNRKTLEVKFKPIFFENEKIIIRANHYTADYFLDTVAELELKVYNKDLKEEKTYPMFLNEKKFEVRLQDLNPGIYNFKIDVSGRNESFQGKFKVLNFDQEQQVLHSDYSSLTKFADYNNSKVYFPDTIENLKKELLSSDQFKAIQRVIKITQSLIDWKWLLLLIVLSLSFEWFIRKYHGFI